MPARQDTLHLQLIGEPRWVSACGTDRLARLDAALLAMLATQPTQPRDRVAAWLWPGNDLQRANLNLRQRLFKLRRRLNHPVVEAGLMLRLAAGVQTDLDDQRGAPPDGELLGGLDFGDLEAFDAWLGNQREALERRRADALAGEAARLESRGALAEAIVLCERIVAQRPALEHAWRRLMRLHYLRGDRSAAVEAFERFEQRVCREHGLRPTGETLALLEAIERLHPAPAVAAMRLPPQLRCPPRLVGREALLAQMACAWDAGRALLLLGEGGIGKSRLMTSFLDGRGAATVVHMRAGDASMPYAGAARLLEVAMERFAPALADDDRTELARLLPALGPAPAAAANQLRLWRAVQALLQACVANGLAIVAIDDLHLADPATLELLRWLLPSEHVAALRWCFAARHEEDAADGRGLNDWLGDSQRLEPVMLEPLAPQAVAELVASLALPETTRGDAAFLDKLQRHAGGHPFFVLETIKALWLGTPDGSGPDLPLPTAVQALVSRRLERLQPTALDLIGLLALGTDAEPRLEVAAAVLGHNVARLIDARAELDAMQLTTERGLAHDIVRACVLARLPAATRRERHRALASALQSSTDTAPGVLARHWWGAGAWDRAACAFAESARRARQAGRLAECEDLWRHSAEAAQRAGDDEARFDAERNALDARMLRLGAEAAIRPLDALQSTARTARQLSAALALRCEILLNLDRAEAALAASSQALEQLADDAPLGFELRMLHGRALALTGRIDEAMVALDAACAGVQADADSERHMQARAALAHALFAAQRLPEALQVQRQALALAHRAGSATEVALQLSNLATVAGTAGDAAQAYPAAQEAHRRFIALGMLDGHHVYNAITLSRHAAHHGRLDEAIAVLAPLAQLDPGVLGATMQALVQVSLLGLELWLGDAAAARSCALQLAQLPRSALAPTSQASVLLALLREAQRAGRPAGSAADELHELGRSFPEVRANPVLYREWARWEEADVALAELDLRIRATASTPPIAHALELVAMDIQRSLQPDAGAVRARRLLRVIGRGLPAVVYPPEAWWSLACALRDGGRPSDTGAARLCLRHARAWVDAAVLPEPLSEAQAMFRTGNPVNRALLADAG